MVPASLSSRTPPVGDRRSAVRAALRLGALVSALASIPAVSHAEQRPSVSLPARVVAAFDKMFDGPHQGMRAVHAKGVLCEGVFVPTPAAHDLSKAEHFAGPSRPVLVRFSNFSGVPDLADNDPLASPRGMAIKFRLPDGGETDIVAHSYDGFPAATPDEFVTLLTTLGSGDAGAVRSFADTHPAARAFLDDPKPAPASYGTERFYGVNAFRFTNAAGVMRSGRYRLVPLAGSVHLSAAEAALQPPNYLSSELAGRLAAGPVRFRLEIQIAGPQDQTTDGTAVWPADRPTIDVGTLTLTGLVADGDALQRSILFTPLNLVDGILPSDDPMLIARSRSYRVSHMRRSEPSLVADGHDGQTAAP